MHQNLHAMKRKKLIERFCQTAAQYVLQDDKLNRLSYEVIEATITISQQPRVA